MNLSSQTLRIVVAAAGVFLLVGLAGTAAATASGVYASDTATVHSPSAVDAAGNSVQQSDGGGKGTIVSVDVPDELAPGATSELNVTIRNDGADDLSEPLSLEASPRGECGSVDVELAPGASETYTTNCTALEHELEDYVEPLERTMYVRVETIDDEVTHEVLVTRTAGDRLDWIASVGSTSPTIVNDTVYVGSYDGHLYGLDADTGEVLLDASIAAGTTSTPAVADGVAYVGVEETLYAVDAETGRERWTVSIGDLVGTPRVTNGTVFVGSESVVAIDAHTGAERWNVSTDAYVPSSASSSRAPTVADGTAYVVSGDDTVTALDAETGEELWNYSSTSGVDQPVTVANGTVYLTTGAPREPDRDYVQALDAETGDPGWSGLVSEPDWLTVAGDTLIAWNDYQWANALDARTGEERWSYSAERTFAETAPTVSNDTVYFAENEDLAGLQAVNASTGERRWKLRVPFYGESSPTIVNGILYVVAEEHLLAVDVEESGSSEDSRVRLGEYGHVGDHGITNGTSGLEVDAVDAPDKVASGSEYELAVTLANHDGVAQTDTLVVDSSDGNCVAERQVTVKAEASKTVAVSCPAPDRALSDPVSIQAAAADRAEASTNVSVSPGTARWSSATSGSVHSSPTLVNETVYVGSGDGELYAFDADTGAERWSAETGDGIHSSPTVANGTVYVGSGDGELYAFDAATGEDRWRVETGGSVDSSPTVAAGTVYVGSDDGSLYALDAETGTQRWSASAADAMKSSPTVADETVYVGSRDDALYAFCAETGEEHWNASTDGVVDSSPTVAAGAVYVGSGDGTLYAFDGETGEQQWTASTDGAVYSSPTVANETVYVGSRGGALYAFAAETGTERWNVSTGDAVYSSPTVAAGVVFAGSDDDAMYALDAATGAERWQFTADGDVYSSPTVANGTAYVGSEDDTLYAVATGSSGSSEDSRVRLGTLGHIDDRGTTAQARELVVEFLQSPVVLEAGSAVELDVTLRNPGSVAIEEELTVEIDGEPAGAATVEVAANATETVAIVADVPAESSLEEVGLTVSGAADDATASARAVHDCVTVGATEVCDANGDGLYRDVTADGSVGQTDVVEFFRHQHRDAWKRPALFDFTGDGTVGHGDVTALFGHVARN